MKSSLFYETTCFIAALPHTSAKLTLDKEKSSTTDKLRRDCWDVRERGRRF
uniref:Uncharacterized protein n=1 Tax=Solanum tuberosum TaxID=4113 RepID=M1BT71_SOLTU